MDIIKMVKELLLVNRLDWQISDDYKDQEKMLKTLMTICPPAQLSDEYYKNESEYIALKKTDDELVNANNINECLVDNIYIYKGDITRIKADAIVNAANEKLLGCFIPEHTCIDNAIHLAAGLGLRNECYEIMQKQGDDEPTGSAKITKGHHLPSKYVIHTVGPNAHKLREFYDRHKIIETIENQLTSCYKSILNLADKQEGINNIVFCSISTGVYGVPIEFAAKVALRTVLKYMANENSDLKKVIINVFTKEDYNEYKKQAQQIRNSDNRADT